MNRSSKGFFPVFRHILPLALLVIFVLFFINGPDYYASRHAKAFWNLGHILFFALLPYCVFSRLKRRPESFGVQGLMTIGACIVLGVLIELFQYGFQRSPDLGDMLRDVIGGLVGIFFLLPSRRSIQNKVLRALQAITVCLVALQIYPVIVAFADEYLARRQFPVLSGFETPWEIQRWKGSADFAVDDRVHLKGKHSLRVLLHTDLYSGVSLFYFPEDWESAKEFRFSVFNPSDENLFITCRINDRKHNQGRGSYDDRFNRRYALPKGWRTIAVPMEEIRDAPNGRSMDLRHIREVGIFAARLSKPRVIFIDEVGLVF